jgi:hypothetical protein
MIEQETVLALIEMKEELEKAQDILWRLSHEPANERFDAPDQVNRCVTHALALIESILARGR